MRYDCHTHVGVELAHWLTGAFPYAQTFPDLVRQLDDAGLDRVVVFPMVTHFALDLAGLHAGRVTAAPVPWSRFPYEFENAQLLHEIFDLFEDLAPRAEPLLMIDPSRQAAEQIAAIERLAERYRVAGLKMQGTMIQSHVANLPRSGFLELAAERDWPVLVHSAVHPDDPFSQVDDILDVVEATPGVRFNVAHSLRFDRLGLDRLATLPNAWCDCSAHCIHCDLALEADSPVVAPRARRFAADYRDPGQVLAALAAAYPQQMLWGSDAPYYSYVATFTQPDGTAGKYDLRSSMARETAALRALDSDALERIAGTNAAAWLRGTAR